VEGRLRLQVPINFKGYWWLPEKPELKIPGICKVSESGKISLELVGLLDLEKFNEKDNKEQIVLGQTERGKSATLIECFYVTRKLHIPGIPKSTLRAGRLLVGAHFNHDDPEFFQILFSIEGLDQWLGLTGISVIHDLHNNSFSINYRKPSVIKYNIAEGIDLSIVFSFSAPSFCNITEVKVTQQAYFVLDFNEPKQLKELLSYVYQFNNFLCLALDKPVALTSMAVSSWDIVKEIAGKTSPVDIEVYYQSLPHTEKPPNVQKHHMLFSYIEISESLGEIISGWLNNYQKLESAFNLYFASTTTKHSYLESRFLFLVQGLETLHRRTNAVDLRKNPGYNHA
jgi:hypothetical protein